mmetsp:Transcript_12282/g.18827  ORF Transcript_12282/g.18827 Transcript_12282/m.18827 type:complete len:95 (+) Transcript_12282:236-520(+)
MPSKNVKHNNAPYRACNMSDMLPHLPDKLRPSPASLRQSSDSDAIYSDKSSTSKRCCSESYALFKRCSTGSISTENISCSDVIISYMHCAMKEC